MKHTIRTLARALYEGLPSLSNLAEEMARQYGKASALSFYELMGENVQFFWQDIARQIIEHSKQWQKNEGSACVLSKREVARLRKLRLKNADKKEKLNRLSDELIDNIINTPDREVLKEVEEDHGDSIYEANKVRDLLKKSQIKASKNNEHTLD